MHTFGVIIVSIENMAYEEEEFKRFEASALNDDRVASSPQPRDRRRGRWRWRQEPITGVPGTQNPTRS